MAELGEELGWGGGNGSWMIAWGCDGVGQVVPVIYEQSHIAERVL